MDQILTLGLQVVMWFQSLGLWLSPVMKFFTFLGSTEFYLLVAPALLWCIDSVLGIRLGLYLMINASVNAALKVAIHGPRPYWYSTDVKALGGAETSFGAPSGHAQNAVVVWGTLAARVKTRLAWIIAFHASISHYTSPTMYFSVGSSVRSCFGFFYASKNLPSAGFGNFPSVFRYFGYFYFPSSSFCWYSLPSSFSAVGVFPSRGSIMPITLSHLSLPSLLSHTIISSPAPVLSSVLLPGGSGSQGWVGSQSETGGIN
jgi:hypothetical protein